MTTRGQINSNFYQLVDVDSNGNVVQIKPQFFANINPNAAGSNTQVQFNTNGHFDANSAFTFNAATGNLVAPKFVGDGSGLSNINASNISGTITNATHANVADVANSVSAANIVGTVANATYANTANISNTASRAGTVTTAAQPNITSLGTLTGVTVNGVTNLGSVGNVKITGGTANYVLKTDGTGNLSWVEQTTKINVAGSNTQIQFNNNGNLGASNNLTYDTSTNTLSAPNFSGSGSDLTNISGSHIVGTVQSAMNAMNAGHAGSADYSSLSMEVIQGNQPNITSLGTLTQLNLSGTVTGNLTPANNLTYSLGTDTNRWKDLYLSGNTIYLGNVELTTDATGLSIPNANITGDLQTSGNAIINGNLTVNGNTYYTNVESLVIEDPIIEQGNGPNNTPLTNNDGKDRGSLLHYYTTEPVDAFMGWDNSKGEFAFGSNVTLNNEVATFNSYGNVRADNFLGNINGANVIGQVSSAQNADYATNATHATIADEANSVAVANVVGLGNIATTNYDGSSSHVLYGNGVWANIPTTTDANYANFAGTAFSVDGANVVGTVGSAEYAGNALDANHAIIADEANSVAGANVTGYVNDAYHAVSADSANSVDSANVVGLGNIASVNLNGLSNTYLNGDGGWGDPTTHPGGGSYSVQFNTDGLFDGDSLFTYDKTTGSVTATQFNGLLNGTATQAYTAVSAGYATSAGYIDDGQGNVKITDGNVIVSTLGLSNVGVFTDSGLKVTGSVVTDQLDLTPDAAILFGGSEGLNASGFIQPQDSGTTPFGGTLRIQSGWNQDVIIAADGQSNGVFEWKYDTTGNLVMPTNTSSINYANGTPYGGGGGGTPGGSNTYVQYNDNGSFAGSINFTFNSATDTLFAKNVSGNGASLTSLTGANVTGTVANATNASHATIANSANSVAGANVTGQVSYAAVANSVAGANVTGQVSYAAVANSVAVANVSGIGNIATVNLNGDSNKVLSGTGTWITPSSGGTPGGSNTQLQFNNNGVFGGISTVTYDGSNLSLGSVSNVKVSGGNSLDVISTDGSGNLSFRNIVQTLLVGTRSGAYTVPVTNYTFQVQARTGNVTVYVN